MHSKSIMWSSRFIGILAIALSNVAWADAPVHGPVEQQASFWLWYGEYGDSKGEVFDPEDFDKLSRHDDQAAPSQPIEEISEDVVNEQSNTDEGPKGPRLNAGKGGI